MAADFVGPERPQGPAAECSQRAQLVADNSKRLFEYIQGLEDATSLPVLAVTVQNNAQEVEVAAALKNLKSAGIDVAGDIKKMEAACKILKNPIYHTEAEVLMAKYDFDKANPRIYSVIAQFYHN